MEVLTARRRGRRACVAVRSSGRIDSTGNLSACSQMSACHCARAAIRPLHRTSPATVVHEFVFTGQAFTLSPAVVTSSCHRSTKPGRVAAAKFFPIRDVSHAPKLRSYACTDYPYLFCSLRTESFTSSIVVASSSVAAACCSTQSRSQSAGGIYILTPEVAPWSVRAR